MTQSIREDIAKKEYEKDGWKVLHKGPPDLLLIKENEDGKIKDVKFREVKGGGQISKLSKEQEKWIEALDFLGLDVDVDYIGKIEIKKYLGESSSDVDKITDEFDLSEEDLYKISQIVKEIKHPRTSAFFGATVAWLLYESGEEVPDKLLKLINADGAVLRNKFNLIAKEKNADVRMSVSYSNCKVKESQINIVKKKNYNIRNKGKNKKMDKVEDKVETDGLLGKIRNLF